MKTVKMLVSALVLSATVAAFAIPPEPPGLHMGTNWVMINGTNTLVIVSTTPIRLGDYPCTEDLSYYDISVEGIPFPLWQQPGISNVPPPGIEVACVFGGDHECDDPALGYYCSAHNVHPSDSIILSSSDTNWCLVYPGGEDMVHCHVIGQFTDGGYVFELSKDIGMGNGLWQEGWHVNFCGQALHPGYNIIFDLVRTPGYDISCPSTFNPTSHWPIIIPIDGPEHKKRIIIDWPTPQPYTPWTLKQSTNNLATWTTATNGVSDASGHAHADFWTPPNSTNQARFFKVVQ